MSSTTSRGERPQLWQVRKNIRPMTLIIFGLCVQACESDVREEPLGTVPGCDCAANEQCINGACVDPTACVDNDQDGFGRNCAAGDDCDDNNARAFPGAPERCDDIDNDCDFFIDEDDVCLGPQDCVPDCVAGETSCAADDVVICNLDDPDCGQWERVPCSGDEYCRFGECVASCEDRDQDGVPVRCEGVREDCDDTRADRYPGAEEVCDGIDNNCDTRVDENFVCDEGCVPNCTEEGTLCAPTGTGFNTCRDVGDGCLRNSGFTPCDAGEVCVDGACSARPAQCVDVDGDGAGPGCGSDDCRPSDASVFAGATELCDGVDNDCDRSVDEGGVCGTCTPSTASSPRNLRADGSWYGVACGTTEFVRVSAGVDAAVLVAVAGGPGVRSMELVGGGSSTASIGPMGAFQGLRATLASGARTAVVQLNTVAGQPVFLGARAVVPANACLDGYEPNGAEVLATPVDRGPFAGAAGLCGPDFDHFAVTARAGEVIVASTVSSTDSAQPLLSIVQAGGQVGYSAIGNQDEAPALFGRHVHFRAPAAGSYTVQTSRLNPADTTIRSYAIAIDTLPAEPCAEDALEVGALGLENDSLATARDLSAGRHSARLCPGDYDIYSLGVSDGGAVRGTFTTDMPNVNVQILEGGWGSVRSFPLDATAAGRALYIAVYSTDHTVTGDYTLRLDN